MELLAWCVSTGLLAALAVYVIVGKRQSALDAELQSLRTSTAVSEARFQDLAAEKDRQASQLEKTREENQSLSNEREGLTTRLNQLERQANDATTLSVSIGNQLRVAESECARLGAELKVASATMQSNATREAALSADLDSAQQERQRQNQTIAELSAQHAAAQNECTRFQFSKAPAFPALYH